MAELRLRHAKYPCPCCGFPTLHEEAVYEICPLCSWEDDGQSDIDADDVWGGPNGELSLSAARQNFADHLTIYDRGHDTRLGGEDSLLEVKAKQALIAAYRALRDRPTDVDLWSIVDQQEHLLLAETDRKLHEGGHLKGSSREHLPNER
jgi:hypothetical protein